MPLSLNEIKDRALAFSREWEGVQSERAEAQSFWNGFFAVFGISRRRVATFEEPVRSLPLFDKQPAKGGRIDLFWRGTLIAEHKSLGGDLARAGQVRRCRIRQKKLCIRRRAGRVPFRAVSQIHKPAAFAGKTETAEEKKEVKADSSPTQQN